jgi:hypothetical protein
MLKPFASAGGGSANNSSATDVVAAKKEINAVRANVAARPQGAAAATR